MTTKLTIRFNISTWVLGLMVMLFCIPLSLQGNSSVTESGSEFNMTDMTVTGTVTSAQDGLPLIGVTVLVSGTTFGTITDVDGSFSIEVDDNAILEFSYTGYKTVTVPVNGQAVLNIVMETDIALLDEVVVIGYGTQKKSHLTGSISKVENEKLDQIAVSRVDDALIGQVSGVNIQATSAEAGAAPTITIRGFGSITAASGPAIVVDGLVVSPDFLGTMDMNNIASFEVLKDAASAAIYGSEGSNGVIMITTKSGKAGKTKFSYESFIGRKEAFGSDDYKKNTTTWAAKELAETGELSDETLYALDIVETTGIDRDWQDVFFDGGNIMSHSLSARGGNDKTTFSTSLRYLSDEGVVLTDDYELYSVNLKLDNKLSDRLRFGLSATPSYSKRRALPTSIHNPIRQSPWLPIYHTEETLKYINRGAYPDVGVGDYFLENHLLQMDFNGDGSTGRPRTSGDQNPYAQYVEYTTNVLGSTYLSYEIVEGLEAK